MYDILFKLFQLQLLIKEVLIGVTTANPGQETGWEATFHMPDKSWVRHFAKRHNLVLRYDIKFGKIINTKYHCLELPLKFSRGGRLYHQKN